MKWDDILTREQKLAASHLGAHGRLLAGPGTGKTLTLTRRIAYLIKENKTPSNKILALTFTRAAAFELKNRVQEFLKDNLIELPQISTLHSFALRQLMKNSDLIKSLPQPLRIVDNWEKRNIIFEDLKEILNNDVKTIEDKFNKLSSDWQTLNVDEEEWEKKYPDPQFLGAWRHHRTVFGYTLLSELVYQLKRSLERNSEFKLESDYLYLLIDEYQDLNRCDLAVISALCNKGIEIYVAGDDDQSIYGFRYAHPEGIRRFLKDFNPSKSFFLRECKRCDKKIIELASFVAGLDEYRIPKDLNCKSDAEEGNVKILMFENQYKEAEGVSKICQKLLEEEDYDPKDILILLRSDTYGAFSSIIAKELKANGMGVAVRADEDPLYHQEGRILLSYLNLIKFKNDNLALKALLKLLDNNIGTKKLLSVYNLSRNNAETFSQTLSRIMENPKLIDRYGEEIKKGTSDIYKKVKKYQEKFDLLNESKKGSDLILNLTELVNDITDNEDIIQEILEHLKSIISELDVKNHHELLRSLSSSLEDKEQELNLDKINIISMHKAKGLTSKAVIIVAAEDEYIPGRNLGVKEGDERRLLYVSLSRAKHFLAITFCKKRLGQQAHLGRSGGKIKRNLTRFLIDAPISPSNDLGLDK